MARGAGARGLSAGVNQWLEKAQQATSIKELRPVYVYVYLPVYLL